MRLQGKAVLLTGAASGIDHAVMALFAEEGATVFAGDIQPPLQPYPAGLRALTKNAAMTYVGDGIRADSAHPGLIDTPTTRSQAPELNPALTGWPGTSPGCSGPRSTGQTCPMSGT